MRATRSAGYGGSPCRSRRRLGEPRRSGGSRVLRGRRRARPPGHGARRGGVRADEGDRRSAPPPPPASVADIGGGPGRYSIWLAKGGYRVLHRDLVPLHVEHVRRDAVSANVEIDTGIADARSLDLPASSVDAVLLLGPLYHLLDRADRITALREAARIVRPGGFAFVAAISRWAPPLRRPRRAPPRGVPRDAGARR